VSLSPIVGQATQLLVGQATLFVVGRVVCKSYSPALVVWATVWATVKR